MGFEFFCSIIELSVSNGTFITDGFLTHNTYQHNTRDTFGFALKSTLCVIDGEEKHIFKDPKTDNGIKKSQKGRVIVSKALGKITFTDENSLTDSVSSDMLTTVFFNGDLVKETSLQDIRLRLRS